MHVSLQPSRYCSANNHRNGAKPPSPQRSLEVAPGKKLGRSESHRHARRVSRLRCSQGLRRHGATRIGEQADRGKSRRGDADARQPDCCFHPCAHARFIVARDAATLRKMCFGTMPQALKRVSTPLPDRLRLPIWRQGRKSDATERVSYHDFVTVCGFVKKSALRFSDIEAITKQYTRRTKTSRNTVNGQCPPCSPSPRVAAEDDMHPALLASAVVGGMVLGTECRHPSGVMKLRIATDA